MVPGSDDDVVLSTAARTQTIEITGSVSIRRLSNEVQVGLKLKDAVFEASVPSELRSGFELEADQSQVNLPLSERLDYQGSLVSGFTARNGSNLKFPGLVEVIGTEGHKWSFAAYTGSQIDLPSLVQVNGLGNITASGSNSIVSLPQLAKASMIQPLGGTWGIEAGQGGAILIPRLTNLTSSTVLRSTGGYLDLSQLKELVSCNFEIQATNLSFTSLSLFDGTSFAATQGAQVAFPALTDWNPKAESQKRIYALGSGSRIEFPNLGTLIDRGNNFPTVLEALSAGQVHFPNLTRVFGDVYFRSGSNAQFHGPGSLIRCDRMESMTKGGVFASFGAQLLMPKLREALSVDCQVWTGDFPETVLQIDGVENFTGSKMVTSGKRMAFPFLTNGNDAYFEAYAGGQLTLSALRHYTNSVEGDPNDATDPLPIGGWTFRATGNTSRLQLPVLQSMHDFGRSLSILVLANQEGLIEAPVLERIECARGAEGLLQLEIEGVLSRISFPRLRLMESRRLANSETYLEVLVKNGATAILGTDTDEVTLIRTALRLTGTGQTESTIQSKSLVLRDGSRLTGSGTFAGNVEISTNSFATTALYSSTLPGPRDQLLIDGDLHLRPEGMLGVSLLDERIDQDFLQIRINGSVDLNGSLAVRQERPVQLTDVFEVISAGRIGGTFKFVTGLQESRGLELKPSYANPNMFALTANPAVSPSIVDYSPVSDVAGIFDRIDVTFSESIIPLSFASEDITLKNPLGETIPVTSPLVDPSAPTGGRTYSFWFQAQTNHGVYSVTIGPNIVDFASIPMIEPAHWSIILKDGPVELPYRKWAERWFTPVQLANLEISGPEADPDKDGIPNREERRLFIENGVNVNPDSSDTDGDGYWDGTELEFNSDPSESSSIPPLALEARPAVEFSLPTKPGTQYQMQRINDLTGKFSNYGEAITGDGTVKRVLLSVAPLNIGLFRVVERP